MDCRIPAGKTWRSHIDQALEQARCVVVAWSKHSISSKWVLEEAGEGMEQEILIPVLLDPVRSPLGFRDIQAADLTGWSLERPSPAFDSFLVDLRALLRAPHAEPTPSPPAAKISPAERALSNGDRPIKPRQVAAVDPGGGLGGRVDTPHASKTPSSPPGQAYADPGDKNGFRPDEGTIARGFLLLGFLVGLFWQVIGGPVEGWATFVVIILTCLIWGPVESYWGRLPRSRRRPMNWIFNTVASIFLLWVLYSCFAP